ncbi:hypothetical protein [Vallitalea sediminicola]
MKKIYIIHRLIIILVISIVFCSLINYADNNDASNITANIYFKLSESTKIEIMKNNTLIKTIQKDEIKDFKNLIDNTLTSVRSIKNFTSDTEPEFNIIFLNEDKVINNANIYFVSRKIANKKNKAPENWISKINDEKYIITVIEYNRFFHKEFLIIKLSDKVVEILNNQ